MIKTYRNVNHLLAKKTSFDSLSQVLKSRQIRQLSDGIIQQKLGHTPKNHFFLEESQKKSLRISFFSSKRRFSSFSNHNDSNSSKNLSLKEPIIENDASKKDGIRLSKLIASYSTNVQMSRRAAEQLIQNGSVTVAGDIITEGSYKVTWEEAISGGGTIKVDGKRLLFPKEEPNLSNLDAAKTTTTTTPGVRVWLAHKLKGELVAENDPHGRPSLIERLARGGVGKSKKKKNQNSSHNVHLKPVGRLDMMTEGLMVITNSGTYARELELPKNSFHRTYRARVHGLITQRKLQALRSGMNLTLSNNKSVRMSGLRVQIELRNSSKNAPSHNPKVKGGNTNTWLSITCTEGKNRQIRRMLDQVGCKYWIRWT